MKKLSKRITLPSCNVDKQLIIRLENYLFTHIPGLLKKELFEQMELYDLKNPASLRTYSLTLSDNKNSIQFDSIKKFKPDLFEPKTTKIVLQLKYGRPELIDIAIIFPGDSTPCLRISTISETVKKSPHGSQNSYSLFSMHRKTETVSSRKPGFAP
jgi:hypothetical protein